MKKLLEKDKKLRYTFKHSEYQQLILKSIFKNLNFSTLTRWNAFLKLHNISVKFNKNKFSNRCLYTFNKKRFNKLTNFSRYVFLKLIRSGKINGLKKSSW